MNVGFKIPIRLDAEPAERSIDLRTYLNFSGAIGCSSARLPLSRCSWVSSILLAQRRSIRRQPSSAGAQREKVAGADSALTDLQYDYSSMENQLTIIKSDPLLQRWS